MVQIISLMCLIHTVMNSFCLSEFDRVALYNQAIEENHIMQHIATSRDGNKLIYVCPKENLPPCMKILSSVTGDDGAQCGWYVAIMCKNKDFEYGQFLDTIYGVSKKLFEEKQPVGASSPEVSNKLDEICKRWAMARETIEADLVHQDLDGKKILECIGFVQLDEAIIVMHKEVLNAETFTPDINSELTPLGLIMEISPDGNNIISVSRALLIKIYDFKDMINSAGGNTEDDAFVRQYINTDQLGREFIWVLFAAGFNSFFVSEDMVKNVSI